MSLIADERRKPHVEKARHHWFRWTLPSITQTPHRVVFIDETSVKRKRHLRENSSVFRAFNHVKGAGESADGSELFVMS